MSTVWKLYIKRFNFARLQLIIGLYIEFHFIYLFFECYQVIVQNKRVVRFSMAEFKNQGQIKPVIIDLQWMTSLYYNPYKKVMLLFKNK